MNKKLKMNKTINKSFFQSAFFIGFASLFDTAGYFRNKRLSKIVNRPHDALIRQGWLNVGKSIESAINQYYKNNEQLIRKRQDRK